MIVVVSSMRLVILMLIILGISSSGAQIYNYTASADKGENGLILDGASEIMMPQISLNTPEGNWTYPYDYYPVYTQNQTISGTFFGSSRLAGTVVGVSVLRLNTSSFQEALKELFKLAVSDKVELARLSSLSLNNSGDGHFAMPGLPSGLYVMLVADPNKLSVIVALPMLVTDDDISLQSPDKAGTSEALEVTIEVLTGHGNISRKYGAAIVSLETYRKARINMSSNGSKSSMTSLIRIGNETLNIRGEPKISQELVDEILPILPQDSALAMDVSNRTESEMYLIHDGDWKPGKYVLTCGIYSNKGLGGIRQKIIELT
jgi:methanogen extracellular protein (TIGR04279 family)